MKSFPEHVAKYRLLWLDMTVSVRDAETQRGFDGTFEIHRRAPLASIESDIERLRPAVAFFDFDFPTKQGLNLLRETKRSHPGLPLIMLTVQHSEALAVWAFRSRVWDYFVKPLSRVDVERCVLSLCGMLSLRTAESQPRTAAITASAIPDEHRTNGRDQSHLALSPAIEYVEKNFQTKVSSARAAALCGLSAFQFSRSFKETYGVTFQEYFLRFRIRHACGLLKNPNAQVVDVAQLVGFNDASYFCKIFKRYTSVAPSRFGSAADAPFDIEALLDTGEFQ
jgi:YesN/AraC family two-component response regulator